MIKVRIHGHFEFVVDSSSVVGFLIAISTAGRCSLLHCFLCVSLPCRLSDVMVRLSTFSFEFECLIMIIPALFVAFRFGVQVCAFDSFH